MNQASYEYNKEQLQYLGFGTEISGELQKRMEQNLTEFTIPFNKKFGNDEVQVLLHFSKGDDLQKDLTFFNRFEVNLKKEGMEDLSQTFFVGQRYNYTLQERYNMMDGRAVYREQPVMEKAEVEGKQKMVPTGETYTAWRALNFKEADPHGNFLPKMIRWHDQAKELEKYPIVGAEENYMKARLVAQLEKGNRVDVTVLKDGEEVKAKMVANAAMLRIDFHDENGQKLDIKKVNRQSFEQSQKSELSPQEVQRAAIAKAAEAKQQNGVSQSATSSPKEDAAQKAGAEQNQQQIERRRQTVRV
ncbi:MAG: hypothetical protein AAGC65_25960 [Mucilaginibacter sp.]|uniref:hypothetical protein n=1 Tax=Mucilaginibacter sp. TaxID=1882438 RepID=UPI0031AF601C